MIYIIFSLQKELKQIPINHLESFLAGRKKKKPSKAMQLLLEPWVKIFLFDKKITSYSFHFLKHLLQKESINSKVNYKL